MPETESRNIERVEWVIYGGILVGTLIAVLLITGSPMGAFVAMAGAVLSATHAAGMMRRAYHTPAPTSTTTEAQR